MNLIELQRGLFAAKKEIDEAMVAYEAAIRADAIADDESRRAKSRSYLTSREQLGGKATVGAIEAAVDLETSELQMRARLAEGLKRSASQAVESRRQWLSALQSLASLTKAEAQLAKWEPRETESV
ncbi:MAG: hypothetical protein ACRDIC_06045 [bacterium]